MADKIIIGGKSVERRELVDSAGRNMGVLEYDPGDIGILTRYPEFESRVNSPELFQRIEKIDALREAGITENAMEIASLVEEIENEIAACIDFLFGIDSKATCFSVKSPLWIHRIETENGSDDAYWFQRIMIAAKNITTEISKKRISAKIDRINAAVADIES